MIGILDSHGMPCFVLARRVRMSPPSTSVWLSRRTTDVSASRLMMSGEPLGGRGSPTSLTVCFTSSATTRLSLIRGVTVRMMPASRYSTALREHVASAPAGAADVVAMPVCDDDLLRSRWAPSSTR